MFELTGAAGISIVVRVVIVYFALLAMLRIAGRRTMSDVTPMDMLVMLLVSETVSPALTAGEDSVSAGLLAAATLVVMAVATSYVVFRSRRAEVLVSGATDVLIRDGHVDPAVIRRHRITDEDLAMALHQHGLLEVEDVARAFVESDGEITIVKRQDVEDKKS